MPTDRPVALALDVGGANLKLAHASGATRSRPFALWRAPGELAETLRQTAEGLPAFGRALLTMTAELCDCFTTRAEGVRHVLDAVACAFPDVPVRVWGVDGTFHAPGAIAGRPLLAAAANWRALAEVAARAAGSESGLLIDVGSTTTDLIPLRSSRAAAEAADDTGRLRTGELVYVGVQRTPLCAVAASLPHRGRATGLCAELFATTRDVYLSLGDLPEDPDDRDTADGRPSTRAAARDRLARMVGADRDSFDAADALALARAADAVILDRLTEAARRTVGRLGGSPVVAVTSGSGEFLARRLARRVVGTEGRVIGLGDVWGPSASVAACARALLELDGADEGGSPT